MSCPCSSLLLAVVALILSTTGYAYEEEIKGTKTYSVGQIFDGYIGVISSRVSNAVWCRFMTVTVSGAGATIRGTDLPNELSAFHFEFVEPLFHSATLTLDRYLPAGTEIVIGHIIAVMDHEVPVVDMANAYLSPNMSLLLHAGVVTYAADNGGAVVSLVPLGLPILRSSRIMLYGMKIIRASSVIHIGDRMSFLDTVVQENSILSVSKCNVERMTNALVRFMSGFRVSKSSAFRISDITMTQSPNAVLIRMPDRGQYISFHSLYILQRVQHSSGSLFNISSRTPTFVSDFTSVTSFLDLSCRDSGLLSAIPSLAIGVVYGQNLRVGNAPAPRTLSGYRSQGFAISIPLENLRNTSQVCRPAICLPANSKDIVDASGECTCLCFSGTSQSMCTVGEDPSSASIDCGEGCTDCRVPRKCMSCRAGYTLGSDGSCSLRSCASFPNCRLCEKNQCVVNGCEFGWGGPVRYPHRCLIKCSVNCISCTSATRCSSCAYGYTVDPDGTCVPFAVCTTTGCERCLEGSSTVCMSCKPGYGLNGEMCEKCAVTNCLECPGGGRTACTRCANKFTLKKGACERADGAPMPIRPLLTAALSILFTIFATLP